MYLTGDEFRKCGDEYQAALTALCHERALVLAASLDAARREAEEQTAEVGGTSAEALARLQAAVIVVGGQRSGGTTAGGRIESDPGGVMSQALSSCKSTLDRLRTERVTRTVDAARLLRAVDPPAGASSGTGGTPAGAPAGAPRPRSTRRAPLRASSAASAAAQRSAPRSCPRSSASARPSTTAAATARCSQHESNLPSPESPATPFPPQKRANVAALCRHSTGGRIGPPG